MTKYPEVNDRHVAVENARRKLIARLQELREEYQITVAEEQLLLASENATDELRAESLALNEEKRFMSKVEASKRNGKGRILS